MSCLLTLAGENFSIGEFLNSSGLVADKIKRKGDPRFVSKPDGPALEQSIATFLVSEAGFMDLKQQVLEVISYLEINQEVLSVMKSFQIDYAYLDFGVTSAIDNTSVLYETFRFPASLLRVAGNLGIALHLSAYSRDMDSVLESRRNKS